jgi:outer membrane biosynthesis protein TonB
MKFNRITYLVLLTMLLALFLVACGGSDEPEPAEAPAETSQPEAPEEPTVTTEPTPEPTDTPEPTNTPEPTPTVNRPRTGPAWQRTLCPTSHLFRPHPGTSA